MATKFKISGGDKISANIRKFQSNFQRKSALFMRKVGDRVLAKAQQRVPYDQGDLHDTGEVIQSSGGQSVTVRFSGPYAVATHEHLSDHSPESWKIAEAEGRPVQFQGGRGPKYLEQPWLEEASTMMGEAAAELNVERVGV